VELTTEALERMLSPLYTRIGIPSRVIESLTGVGARRFWAEGASPTAAAGRSFPSQGYNPAEPLPYCVMKPVPQQRRTHGVKRRIDSEQG
jgi:hypothetical protein